VSEDLRKEIAAQAAGLREPEPSLWLKAGQLFLIPAGIVAVAVSLYLFVGWMTSHEEHTAIEWVTMIRTEGRRSRSYAAAQLSALLQKKPGAGAEQGLASAILDAFDQISRDNVLQGEDLVNLKSTLIRCVAATRDVSVEPRVVKALQEDADVRVRAACMEVLGTLRGPLAAGALAPYVSDADPALRKYAVFNLAATGERARIELIKSRLGDPVTEVAWNAAVGLAWFHKDASGADLLRQMLDRESVDRYTSGEQRELNAQHTLRMACRAAAALGDPSFEAPLSKLERDRSPDVRQDARTALEEIRKHHGR
jgi:hypothetical protein